MSLPIRTKKMFSITNKGKPTHCKVQSNKTNTFVHYLAGGEGHNRTCALLTKVIMLELDNRTANYPMPDFPKDCLCHQQMYLVHLAS